MSLRIYRSNSGSDGGGNAGNNPPPAGGAADARPYTRQELDAMFADVRRGADNAATQRLLKQLGVDKIEDATAAIEDAKKVKQQQMTEGERLAAEKKDLETKLQAEKDSAKAARTDANRRIIRSLVLVEAQAQGFDKSELESVWRDIRDDNALMESIKPTGEDDYEGITDAVKKVAERHPRWLADNSTLAGDGVGTGRPKKTDSKPNKPADEKRQNIERSLRASGAYRP